MSPPPRVVLLVAGLAALQGGCGAPAGRGETPVAPSGPPPPVPAPELPVPPPAASPTPDESQPPDRCPPVARGAEAAIPLARRFELGGRTLQLLICPEGGPLRRPPPGEPRDVVWWSLSGTSLGGRLIPDDNWSRDENPRVGGQRLEVLGPLADGAHAVVLASLDFGWGHGHRTVWVVGPKEAVSEGRAFSGQGGMSVKGGVLRAVDGDPSESEYDVAALDARWRWEAASWAADGPPLLRTDLGSWPCAPATVPVLDPTSGAPTGEVLTLEREMRLTALEFRSDVGGGPIFLIEAGDRRAWVRQVTQSCAG